MKQKIKCGKIKQGKYRFVYKHKEGLVWADYFGKGNELCDTIQAWTLRYNGKTVKGFSSKKQAVNSVLDNC